MKAILQGMVAVASGFLLAGCGSTGAHLRWYAGPPHASNEVALVKVHRSVLYASAQVQTIDGEPIAGGRKFVRNNTVEIELLPGDHTLGVAYFEGQAHSLSNAALTANYQPGHTYELKVDHLDMGLGQTLALAAVGGRFWWTAWIVDTQTGNVIAGSPRREPRRWYEY